MTPAEMLRLAAEAEARASKATPGPWRISTQSYDERPGTNEVCDLVNSTWIVSDSDLSMYEQDAAFIAHARADVPALCAALREAVALLERAEARQTPPTDREVLEMAREGGA